MKTVTESSDTESLSEEDCEKLETCFPPLERSKAIPFSTTLKQTTDIIELLSDKDDFHKNEGMNLLIYNSYLH